MKCTNCGKEIDNDSVFCEFCGTKIQKQQPPAKKGNAALWVTLGIIGGLIIAGIIVAIVMSVASNNYSDYNYSDYSENNSINEEVALSGTLNGHEWVDLGLPSGTLWKDKNENGLYDYGTAERSFGSKLPTKEQYEELKNSCSWTWTGDSFTVVGPSGEYIVLPAVGSRDCAGDVSSDGSDGTYWLSTPDSLVFKLYFFFDSSRVGVGEDCLYGCVGYSVRLVHN